MTQSMSEYLQSIQPAPIKQTFVPSAYQVAISKWIREGSGHGVVEGVAGCGKTTTLVNSIADCHAASPGRILFTTFTKNIAEELKRRIPQGVQCAAYTINAFGWTEICRKQKPGVKLDRFKDDNILKRMVNPDMERERYYRIKNPLLRMVSLIKAINGNTRDFEQIASDYGVELGDIKPMDRFPDVLADVYRESINNIQTMSFDDQTFQPIFRNWPVPSYRWVLVDEAQDLSPIQIELVRRLAEYGRLILVGDPDQSIYLFRGAHPDAMGTVAAQLSATQLPLSVCYRCKPAIVESAQKQVDRIQPAPGAEGGVVEWVSTEDFIREVEPGDLVLSRTTAPLVKRCLEFIRNGVKAYVKGRDVGQGLVTLIEKIHGNPDVLADDYYALYTQTKQPHAPDITAFLQQVDDYYNINSARLERANREQELINLEMNIETIKVLAEKNEFVAQIIHEIEQIFADNDDRTAIMFMTGHKAKGLENERVYILRLDQCPHKRAKTEAAKRQEKNLLYVMKTRAQEELYFVQKEKDEK